MTDTTKPRLGMRVRFTRYDHYQVPYGMGGFVDQIHASERAWFVVLTDCGGLFVWTTLASWEPTGEPDVEMPDEYRAMREAVP